MISSQDRQIIRDLIETYGIEDMNRYVDSVNEYMIGTRSAKSAALKTQGTKDTGAKGLLKSVPGAAISLALSWPGALIAALGAINVRNDSRWLKSVFNPNYWLDYLATPRPKKEKEEKKRKEVDASTGNKEEKEVEKLTPAEKKKIEKEELRKNTKFYYAELSNSEVVRVRAIDTAAAKEQVDKIIDYIPYGKLAERQREGMHTYRVVFDNFEESLWVANSPEQAKVEVKSTRAQLEAMYRQIGYIPERVPAILEVIDEGPVPVERPSKSYSVSENIPLSMRDAAPRRSVNGNSDYYNDLSNEVYTYKIRVNNNIFNVPGLDKESVNDMSANILKVTLDIYKKNIEEFKKGRMGYLITMSDGDKYIVYSKNEANLRPMANNIEKMKWKIVKGLKQKQLSDVINRVKVPTVMKVEQIVNSKGKVKEPAIDNKVTITKNTIERQQRVSYANA